MERSTRWRSLVAAVLLVIGLAGPATATPDGARVARGVTYRLLEVPTARGPARLHVVTVDLDRPGVSVGLLHPGAVAAREPLTRLAGQHHAVAAVNGDFFNVSEEQHPGVPATGAPVGPEVAEGRPLKGAVPTAQRFGWPLPPGGTVEDVLAGGFDGRPRLGRLHLRGTVDGPQGTVPLRGLNQYAIAEDGIGAFTPEWGATSRARAVCGTDLHRWAPCSGEAYEVTVRHGRVAAGQPGPGSGRVPEGAVVLLGREAGARYLRGLRVGDRVEVDYHLADEDGLRPHWALGASPILRDGRPLTGQDASQREPRAAAALTGGGHTLLLVTTDGRSDDAPGLTMSELADTLQNLGATTAVQLDGGSSATMVTRTPSTARPAVRNRLDGGERPIANGIGVFVR
ncbi:phosphodiester glycosidase family protein [Streptomyces sp. SP17BM10]|uniref:phosphodiester glycosidase family protein n=1 Tax=Streptomyces sp. SP17BM10 TaxID=3002530 RepID=UPI002E76104C|nr:phosphodiester glycosidase family protein [Streptomyces sp. SP17BM10]MEE1782915.1 phosphodiester glycosidase family protein [Streptomyces sp. SP17BM10]